MDSTHPSGTLGNAAVDLLISLLMADQTADRRTVPARKLNQYGSSMTERRRIAALVCAHLRDNMPSDHPLRCWQVDYIAADLVFAATKPE